MTDNCQIFSTISLAALSSIFTKTYIQNPMQLVLNTPMTSNSSRKSLDIALNMYSAKLIDIKTN